jgi:esterase/lipase
VTQKLEVPLLVLYTAHDPLVSQQGVESWFEKLPLRDKSALFFAKSYHLVLHDVESRDALREGLDWLERRAK